MDCPACGAANAETSRFCGSCGAPLVPPDDPHQERKVVTAVFADLVGFTSRSERLDPEDVRATVAPLFARVRTELERRGGTVEKFIGDAVMALFGAPTTHEDDPERAVRAALAIRDLVVGMNEEEPSPDLHVRIGVNTGEALVALDARPAEGEGVATGDVINTAARLQAAAPVDGILVGEHTYRSTSQVIEYRVADPVQAKGKAHPVLAWEAVEARSRFGVDIARAMDAPLVGRERELSALKDSLERVRANQAIELVTLVGEPGIGKSRLVAELFRFVDEEIEELVAWRQGRCLPYGEGVSFWALSEMVKAQAGILETDRDDEAAAKLRRSVAVIAREDEVEWIVRHLRPLIGLGPGSDVRGEAGEEAFAAWRSFLEALAERSPAILVFEDLHWADEGLLDFIDRLVDDTGAVPLLVICTARPELLTRRPGWGGGKTGATTLTLPPLTGEETARLFAQLLHASVLPAELQDALLSRAGGNPLYAEEFARMAGDRGADIDPEHLPMPETVQGIIAARLDGLDPGDKRTLQQAAVVGKVFWLGSVAAAGGWDRDELDRRLHGLERRRFVRRERRSSVAGETEYAFLHLLARDVAYGQLPRGQRAELHRRAAEWTASLSDDRLEDRAELLAHHYLQAIELGRAAGNDVSSIATPARLACRAAGDRAMSLFSPEAAIRYYRAAVELWPDDDPERSHLLLRLGRSLWYGQMEGTSVLDEAERGLLAAGDVEGAAQAVLLMADLKLLAGHGAEAEERFDRAGAMVEGLPPSPATARVLAHIARTRLMAGHHQDAIAIGRRALAIAERLGIDDVRSAALNTVGTSRASLGDREALTDIELAIELAERAHAPWDVSRGCVNLAYVKLLLGEIPGATALHERALATAERFGNEPAKRWNAAELAIDRFLGGDWPTSLAMADRFLAGVDAGAPHYMEGAVRGARAWILLTRGDVTAAERDSEIGLASDRAVRDPQALYVGLGQRARLLWMLGRGNEAVHLVDELLGLVADETDLLSPSSWGTAAAVVLEAMGRGGEATQAIGRGSRTPWTEATLAWAAGDLASAAAAYQRLGARGEAALARRTLASRLIDAGRGEEARPVLEEASAFFRAVGSAAFVKDLEARLAESA